MNNIEYLRKIRCNACYARTFPFFALAAEPNEIITQITCGRVFLANFHYFHWFTYGSSNPLKKNKKSHPTPDTCRKQIISIRNKLDK